jgi:hypothetical protein
LRTLVQSVRLFAHVALYLFVCASVAQRPVLAEMIRGGLVI